jgi:hypothetical protein
MILPSKITSSRVGINLRSQQADELAVDADFAVQNHLLPRAPRSHAGIREKFLQTNVQSAECGVRSAESDIANGFSFRTPHSDIPHLSSVGLRFAQTGDAVAGFALAAFFEERRALETLEDIALAAQGGRRAETAML